MTDKPTISYLSTKNNDFYPIWCRCRWTEGHKYLLMPREVLTVAGCCRHHGARGLMRATPADVALSDAFQILREQLPGPIRIDCLNESAVGGEAMPVASCEWNRDLCCQALA